MILRRLAVGALVAALAVTACGSSSGSGTTGTIKIGVTGPFSGNYAAPGIDILNAAKVMATTLNKSGGINGQKVEIVSADDQCDAQVGVQAATNLLSQKVVALVGGYCSGASIPESDVLRKQGNIPFITVASSNPKFTEQGYNNVFRVILRDDFARHSVNLNMAERGVAGAVEAEVPHRHEASAAAYVELARCGVDVAVIDREPIRLGKVALGLDADLAIPDPPFVGARADKDAVRAQGEAVGHTGDVLGRVRRGEAIEHAAD